MMLSEIPYRFNETRNQQNSCIFAQNRAVIFHKFALAIKKQGLKQALAEKENEEGQGEWVCGAELTEEILGQTKLGYKK